MKKLMQIDALLENLRSVVAEDFEKAVTWAKSMIQGISKTFGGTFGGQKADVMLPRLAAHLAKELNGAKTKLTGPEEEQALQLIAQHFKMNFHQLAQEVDKRLDVRFGKEPEHSFSSPEELTKAMMLRHHAVQKGLHPGAMMHRLKSGASKTPGDEKNAYDDQGNYQHPETGVAAEKPFPTDQLGKIGKWLADYSGPPLTPKTIDENHIQEMLQSVSGGELAPADLKSFGDYMRRHTSRAFMRRRLKNALAAHYGERQQLENELKSLQQGKTRAYPDQLKLYGPVVDVTKNLGFDLDDVYPELAQYRQALIDTMKNRGKP